MTTVGYHLGNDVRVAALSGRLAGLTPTAILCLHVMAQVALDKPTKTEPARIYFAGWEYLALAGLGREEYDAAAEKTVERAVRQLVERGLVKPVGRRNGVRAGATLYELVLP